MALFHYHGGSGSQRSGDTNSNWRSVGQQITQASTFKTTVEGNYSFDHGIEFQRTDYYYDNDIITGIQTGSATTNSYIKGDFPFTFSKMLSSSATLSEFDYTKLAFSGQDIVDGSSDGGSLFLRTHGGDDLIRLHTGTFNNVIGGEGNDYLQNWSWFANGEYSGAAGNDVFSVANGTIYGGKGADTFQLVPMYLDPGGIHGPISNRQTYAWVRDFEIGVDKVVGSGLPILHEVNQFGLWLKVEGGTPSMLIADVFDINSLGIV